MNFLECIWKLKGLFTAYLVLSIHINTSVKCGYQIEIQIMIRKTYFSNRELNLTINHKIHTIGTSCMRLHCLFARQVGIAGVPADVTMKETKIKEDNWVPTWEEEFTFPLTVPELALLRVEVQEYDMSETDDFAGQTCLPITELKQGIHAVPLYDRKGKQYKSVRLLMRFDFI